MELGAERDCISQGRLGHLGQQPDFQRQRQQKSVPVPGTRTSVFRLVHPLAAVLCIQLVGGEGHPLLTSFGRTQTHFLSPHRQLSSTWSLGHIQLPGWLGNEVQPCGLPVKARRLYHISPTQGRFIHNGIKICDAVIILHDIGVYF